MSWKFDNLPDAEKPRLYAEYHAGNIEGAVRILDAYQVRSGCAVCDKNHADTRDWLDWYAAQAGNEHLKHGNGAEGGK